MMHLQCKLLLLLAASLSVALAPATAQLVCDGKERVVEMAVAPFPTSPPWTPWVGPPGVTCTRPLPGTSRRCGSQILDTCGAVQFSPILQSSGVEPGIIPPTNPLQFSTTPGRQQYFKYVEFRMGNIGTGGARLKGIYAPSSQLLPVFNSYEWVKNGPTVLPDNTTVYGSCGDCREGFGIKSLKVEALNGAGFTTFEISQLYADVRCEASGVNVDGVLIDGSMKYACVQPTCGDTDLDREGAQPFIGCVPPLFFDPNKKDNTPPSVQNCCSQGSITPTCGNVINGLPFQCPDGYQYDKSKDSVTPPSLEACCLRTSCDNITPATQPGRRFDCGPGYEFNTFFNPAVPPSLMNCCKPATCADTRPVSAPGTPFTCAANTVFNPTAGPTSPPSQDACCLKRTCGSPDPFNPSVGFQCAAGTEFDPASISTSPPSQGACCKVGTCKQPFPVSNPTATFSCGADFEYDPKKDGTSPPSVDNCCVPKTCANLRPVTDPGRSKWQCPAGQVFNEDNANRAPPSNALCCKAFAATCGDTDPGPAVVPFNCFPLLLNVTNLNLPASFTNCCYDPNNVPQSDVDVYVFKTVSPAVDAPKKLSTLELVGFEFTWTLEVGVLALAGVVARDVVMVDNLPPGFELSSISENPDKRACTYTLTTITCTWAEFPARTKAFITLKTKSVSAGVWTNRVRVTTTSNETNPSNNNDTATARVEGACCDTRTNACIDTLPDQCTAPSNAFDRLDACNATKICRTPSTETGACCVNTNNVVTCIDNVPEADCKAPGRGRWNKGKKCDMIDCNAPTGACCEIPSGTCRDNVLRTECANRHSWMVGRRCGQMQFCAGGCCAGGSGNCTVTTKDKCAAGSKWTLYAQCDEEFCPADVCIPPWWSCNPTVPDPCCPGYTCQATYKKCYAGPYVCQPSTPTCDSGCYGKKGKCCSGKGCFWDHKKSKGKCYTYERFKCGKHGSFCTTDTQCCLSHRCINGQCDKITKDRCHRKCKDWSCFTERQKDCDCLYAATASDPALVGV